MASPSSPPLGHIPLRANHVVLRPGEVWFGGGHNCVETLLGSCVAITLWHPKLHIGGMCHYLLADKRQKSVRSDRPGYYATEAIRFFSDKVRENNTRPQDYEVKMFGGGDMFPSVDRRGTHLNVPRSNIDRGLVLLQEEGFSITTRDVGGIRYRTIFLELWSGDVWVRYGHNTRSPV